MKAFTYERADSADAAPAQLAPDGKYLAGGTNLLDLMKLEIEAPAQLLDLNHAGLDTIEATADGGLRIGALVRNTALAADPRVRREYEVLSRAILAGASTQIRNRASTAGNLLQRTRCHYFYDRALPCNKREPGTGCGALAPGGVNRDLAVVGVSDSCIAQHPSDMAVALRVLGAEVETRQVNGETRRLALDDFYRLPGNTPHIENALEPGELVTAVILPPPAGPEQSYRKVRDRSSYAFAAVSLATVKGGRGGSRWMHFAFGGLAPRPWRMEAAEELLAQGADAVFDKLFEDARPTEQNAFKLVLARRLLAEAMNEELPAHHLAAPHPTPQVPELTTAPSGGEK
ncbi:FAD binding domain-containing protein [Deinococcus sp. PESE-13]